MKYQVFYIKNIRGEPCNTLLIEYTDINYAYRFIEKCRNDDRKEGLTKRDYEVRLK